MEWINNFQLYLFDLDGLLVNTEFIHYMAYIDMFKRRGFNITWSFIKYFEVAQVDSDSLKESFYGMYPDLFDQEPNWEVLRREKNKIYMDLLKSSKVELMPGAKDLLEVLEKRDIKRCVVTHSAKEMTDLIRANQKILNTIPNWITREDYINPKPSPESYNRAIALFAKKGDKIIGFEDSIRGLRALSQTIAKPVLINEKVDPRINDISASGIYHFKSIEVMLRDNII